MLGFRKRTLSGDVDADEQKTSSNPTSDISDEYQGSSQFSILENIKDMPSDWVWLQPGYKERVSTNHSSLARKSLRKELGLYPIEVPTSPSSIPIYFSFPDNHYKATYYTPRDYGEQKMRPKDVGLKPLASGNIRPELCRFLHWDSTFPEDYTGLLELTAEANASACTHQTLHCALKRQLSSKALYKSMYVRLLPGTEEWLWFSKKFMDWRNNKVIRSLWVCGSPGSGKSMLAASILKKFEEDAQEDEIVAFHFFDGRFRQGSNINAILLALLEKVRIRKYANTKDFDAITTHLNTIKSLPSMRFLRSTVLTILHSLGEDQTIYLILDGLDEIEDDHGDWPLLTEILRLASQNLRKHCMKILITSGPELLKKLPIKTAGYVNMDIEKKVSVDDLQRYITKLVQSNSLPSEWTLLIESALSKVDRPILRLHLILETLRCDDNQENTQNKLQKLLNHSRSTDLATIYRDLLRSLPRQNLVVVTSMLAWVMYAARPMYTWELIDAVSFVTGTCIEEKDIERLSGGILLTSRSRTVNLVHSSARKILVDAQNTLYLGDEFIARVCSEYVDFNQVLLDCSLISKDESQLQQADKKLRPLEAYAHENWAYHYARCEGQSNSISGILHQKLWTSLSKCSNISELQEQEIFRAHQSLADWKAQQDILSNILRLASWFGYYKLAKIELEMGAELRTTCGVNYSSLQIAAECGHEDIVRLLLNYRTDKGCQYEYKRSPLFLAIANGHVNVVQALLEHNTSAAFGAFAVESMEEFELEVRWKEWCSTCSQKQAIFNIIKTLQNKTISIGIQGEISLESVGLYYDDLIVEAEHKVHFKWLPGPEMQEALECASAISIDYVRDLLQIAGNPRDLFTQLLHLGKRFTAMAI